MGEAAEGHGFFWSRGVLFRVSIPPCPPTLRWTTPATT
jgi:hypothetical protein